MFLCTHLNKQLMHWRIGIDFSSSRSDNALSWRRQDMKMRFLLLALCKENPSITSGVPSQWDTDANSGPFY